jgi:hypothetical protein
MNDNISPTFILWLDQIKGKTNFGRFERWTDEHKNKTHKQMFTFDSRMIRSKIYAMKIRKDVRVIAVNSSKRSLVIKGSGRRRKYNFNKPQTTWTVFGVGGNVTGRPKERSKNTTHPNQIWREREREKGVELEMECIVVRIKWIQRKRERV